MRSGTLTVNAGAIKSTASTFDEKGNGSGTTMTGVAVAVSQHVTDKDLKVVINGGTLTGPYALYEKDLQNETGTKALEIKDGIFEGQVYSKDCTAFIKGGTFSDVSALESEERALIYLTDDAKLSFVLGKDCTVSPSSVSGVSIDYLNIRQLSVEQGEMFSENDIRTAAKVCVIGKTIVDNLFPDGSDPIGKVIRCNQIPMRVVGVLKSKGYNSMGQDQDDVVLAPYTTVMKRLLAQTYLGGIFASALTEDMTEEAVEEITSILRREHKLKATDDDDFTIRTQQELSSMLNTTTDLMTTLLACIAGISLVVGGIGIMNIMYVSVTERTREIGLRMSVGARGVDILSQFLIEAILISITGGVIGVIIGCGASFMIKSIAHWPVFIQPWSVLLSFAVCTITGVFFGWYPAKKAADLDPIDAIRYE